LPLEEIRKVIACFGGAHKLPRPSPLRCWTGSFCGLVKLPKLDFKNLAAWIFFFAVLLSSNILFARK